MARGEVLVLGAGMGGLSAAIHARLRGYDVVVVERGPIGGKAAPVQAGGYRFDPGPSIVILPEIYQEVLRAAGRRPEDYLTFLPLDPITAVRWEGKALHLPAGREPSQRWLESEFPEDAAAFAQLMERLDRAYPHVERSVFARSFEHPWQLANPHLMGFALQLDVRTPYRQIVDATFRSPLLRAFFYGFPSYGGQSYTDAASGAFLIPYLMIERGVWFPHGGVSAIPQAFERLARELGVEFRRGDVSAMKTDRHGVEVQTREGERLQATWVIANVDRSTVRAWLGQVETAPPSYSYFTLQWGLRKRIPLDHHTLIVRPGWEAGFDALYRDHKFPEPPIVYLNEVAGTDPSSAPAGGGNLFAVITSPAEREGFDWEAKTPQLRQLVLRVMGEAGVDVEGAGIEVERVQTPSYFRREHGNYGGSLYGVDSRSRPFGGMFPHGVRDPDFPNVFYCGGSVQPGAGLPMVTLSGRFAAERLP